jgi:phage shock protein E
MKKLFAFALLPAAALLLAGCAWLNQPIEVPTSAPVPTASVSIPTPGPGLTHTPPPAKSTPSAKPTVSPSVQPSPTPAAVTPSPKPSASIKPSASPTPTATPVYRMITPEDAKALIGKEGTVLLDVRSKFEYDAGHIKGASLLPFDLISQDAKELPQDKADVIIVYCLSGWRSAIAAETLAGYGYTSVYDLGSILDWSYGTVTS